MTAMLALAARSAWSRRFVLALVVSSIALATLLLLGLERIRSQVRDNFAQSVSGTDLIVGARTGPAQLLLYSVFRIGGATSNIAWTSVLDLADHRAVAWVVPLSLGDSHRGFPVVATSAGYFEHFAYGDRQRLALAQGRPFDSVYDAVLGADVARRLGYGLGERLILSHGDGVLESSRHGDKPFTVTGILQPTGTPVDRSVHISLQGMEAIHQGWGPGMALRLPARPATSGSEAGSGAGSQGGADLTPRSVTAVLVGLKNRAAVFSVQRHVAEYRREPLMAILPGVALDELWEGVAMGERALLAATALVTLVSLAGLVAVILAGLEQRRRELAILRAVGAGPAQVLWLLACEGMLVTLAGVAAGTLFSQAVPWLLGGWLQARLGIGLQPAWPAVNEWLLMAAVLACGVAASLVPGYRAYRLSLADGLSPRMG
jgi:putative ABC transport system permease protein